MTGTREMNEITINIQPEPIGYWRLAYGGSIYTQFAMYAKPTDEQIKNTKELLGWEWIDEKAQEK